MQVKILRKALIKNPGYMIPIFGLSAVYARRAEEKKARRDATNSM
jgi:hypothetical protein